MKKVTWPSEACSVRRDPSLGLLQVSMLSVGDRAGTISMLSWYCKGVNLLCHPRNLLEHQGWGKGLWKGVGAGGTPAGLVVGIPARRVARSAPAA